ncbi:hypothetical protein ML462_07015 [Gramella lutea]|uniref:Uncharacterized protein n=1 Tax=Christiangramia lutea TaxID=1607951 RepID=A0A9X1V3B8_9FLAO|nr:hypothetical protein [Christiangramia lutea]MCH4822921.1 hypothetical protein [Christiangramia lutea]
MTAEQILTNVDASLQKREKAAEILASSEDLRRQSLSFIENRTDLSLNGLMVFEILGRMDFNLITPFISTLVQIAHHFTDSSSRRYLAKIFSFAISADKENVSQFHLSPTTKLKIIELSFLWLISEEKTAGKVFSMQNIYDLKDEESWIEIELKAILEKDLPGSSAGYKSRGSKILRKLRQ